MGLYSHRTALLATDHYVCQALFLKNCFTIIIVIIAKICPSRKEVICQQCKIIFKELTVEQHTLLSARSTLNTYSILRGRDFNTFAMKFILKLKNIPLIFEHEFATISPQGGEHAFGTYYISY